MVAFPWQASWDASRDDGSTPTLPANQTLAIAQNQRGEVRDLGDKAGALAAEPGMKQQTYVMNLRGREGGSMPELDDLASLRASAGGSSRSYVAGTQVRRLTPLECERLQGFPDGWTAIPGNSDTQRYRQLGNAVAVPVVEWIMRRIAAAEQAGLSGAA